MRTEDTTWINIMLCHSLQCYHCLLKDAKGPTAEWSESSDLGQGDPGSNPGEGRFFSAFIQDGELS